MDFKHNPSTDFEDIDKLSKPQAEREAEALREGINYHDYLYYVKNRPEISDAVYDKLFKRLEELEQAFPELKSEDSPTARVGAEPVSELKKVKHTAPLLSLEATLDKDELAAFLKRAREGAGKQSIRFDLEPKFDGLSVEVVYEKGRFKYGATRGNGETGEDVSHNLKTIHTVPLSLQNRDRAPDALALRGEVFMPKDGFVDLNRRRVERGEEAFANPRNAAAGLIRQYESRHVADKPLDIFFYEILSTDGDMPDDHQTVLKQLGEWGLQTCPLNASATRLEDIEKYHRKLAEQRDDLDYEIDGIVVKLDDYGLRESLGTRSRNPRWALAWKFEPREEVTTVNDIVVQVGRTGILTPVALLQPVDVGGVTVSRATLHNEDEVHRKDVRVGDRVRIIRAGDVIPEVKERVKQSGKKRGEAFSMPERCPVCDSEVVREGAYYLCTAGLSCPAQLAGRIEHYGARDAMDIDQLGEKTARQLVRQERVHDLADLYGLSIDQIESLEGFAHDSAKKLHDAIRGATAPRLDRFLYALGIRHVGRRVARDLASHFGSLDALADADRATVDEVPGIGPEIAESVANFFADEDNRDVLKRMRRAGLKVKDMPGPGKQPLRDKRFVFTGALDSLTRDEAKERIEALGARATSSVSDDTDYVVVGNDPGSKLDDARQHNVKRIAEDEFLKLLDEAG